MSTQREVTETADFTVENIGGIDYTEIEIPPGVSVLTGPNATNRTSFLQSIMAAMGSTQATLKGDAEEGYVQLNIGQEKYKSELTQAGDTVYISGDTYLDDASIADLFAFLLESNEARQAVASGGDLREIIMRPVDVDELKHKIKQLETEKGDINDKIASIESKKKELPKLEQRRNAIRDQIKKKEEKLTTKESEIEQSNRNIEQSREIQEELEEKLSELSTVRSKIESTRRNIQSQQESISSLEQERAELESEMDSLPEAPMGEHQQFEDDIRRLRSKRQNLNAEISDLQSLIQYNDERLEKGDHEILSEFESTADTDSDKAVVDTLLENGMVTCWTCGSKVERAKIDETVSSLKNLRLEKMERLDEVKSQLDDLKSQQQKAKQKQQRRKDIGQKLTNIDDELEERKGQVESLKQERETLIEKVETLESEVNSLESADFEEILSLHQEANQLEFEIESLEEELEEINEEIKTLEGEIDRADELREQRQELVAELRDKRTKIDQIEQEAVDEFNEHMDAVLDILDYDNLDRVWIERVAETVRDGRKKAEQSVFDLHVVRTTESGTAYEDTIGHLSESEREVTGLVFALAGYLVHELHETVPFMLLDSLEAIDSERISRLVDYFSDYQDYLVVALLPEDAESLDGEYTRITDI
jgi:DNA repair exonuclease SbcCD ATPase subunit